MGRRVTAHHRPMDWTGFITAVTVSQGTQVDQELFTPIINGEISTLTRIRGQINPCLLQADVGVEGENVIQIFMGIQIVNRVKGSPGSPRSPQITDDLEGSQWLWLGMTEACWFVTGSLGEPPDYYVPTGGFLTGSYDATVDVKAQRRIDQSQDAVVLSLVVGGAAGDNMRVSTYLRLLWKR